mmetsp:Transcript_17506/g.25901  ORF Transcript_17506/g.25901 Transcript_17506/m.25901 type:complete len:503 (+) Transcript_17506:195-1703(+)
MPRDSSSIGGSAVGADASVHEDINNYTEIAHSIFGQSVGNCYGSFSCNLTRQHGRLYVASRAIMFYSNLFGFERRLCLPLSDVIDIKIYRSTSIFIAMFDGEEFIFKSFSHRERVVVLVKKLIAAARAPETLVEESEISETAILTETVDDPDHQSRKDDEVADGEGTETIPRTRSQSSDSMAQSCPTTIVIDKVHDVDAEIPAELQSIRTQSNNSIALLSSEGPKRKSSTGDLTEDLFESWKKVSESKQKDEDTLVDGVMLDCSLSIFFDLFLSDDAMHSLSSFHEHEIGDTDIELTKWTNDHSGIMNRTFSFRHPISNKLGIGPSSTRVTQKQNLERYGNFGICMQTTTHVKGVPSSDAFYVSAKWLVESDNDNINVRLKVLNKVVFTKGSLFKRAILSSSREEAKSFYERYVAMLISHVQGTSQEKSEELPTNELKSHSTFSVTTNIWFQVSILIVLVLFLQNYLLRTQVQSLHNDLSILKQKQSETTELMKNILQRLSE